MKRLAGLVLFFVASRGGAQGLPSELHLQPPARAKWTIVYTQTDTSGAPTQSTAPAAKRRVESDYEITDNLAHLTEVYSDGSRKHTYMVDSMSFFDDLQNHEIKAIPSGIDLNNNVGFKRVYPGFEWVSKQDYVDTVEKGKLRLFHFRQDESSPSLKASASASPTPTATAKVNREAWIDVDTGLPVYFQTGKQVGVYHFAAPPTEKLVFPAAYEEARSLYFGH